MDDEILMAVCAGCPQTLIPCWSGFIGFPGEGGDQFPQFGAVLLSLSLSEDSTFADDILQVRGHPRLELAVFGPVFQRFMHDGRSPFFSARRLDGLPYDAPVRSAALSGREVFFSVFSWKYSSI
jgi:hypothetical protein